MSDAPRDIEKVQTTGGVLFVSHNYGYANDLLYYGPLLNALRGHEPDLTIAIDKRADYANPYDLPLEGLYDRRSIRLPGRGAYVRLLHLAAPGFARTVARRDFDVVAAVEFTPVTLLALSGARRAKRVLLVESDPRLRGGNFSPLSLAIKRRAIAAAHVVQTNNEAGARYCVDVLRCPTDKVIVAPYLTSRPPGPVAKPTLSRAGLRLLFANSLTERKNAGLLLDALQLLSAEVLTRVHCTVVGDGEKRAVLERKARDAGLEKHVHFVGHVPYADLGLYHAQADVLVNPTRADYRSLASFEGLGYGLALLVSNADGAAKETVIEGRTGHSFAPDDAAALASHITHMANNPERLLAMRRAAYQLYEERFSVEQAASNLAATIDAARRA